MHFLNFSPKDILKHVLLLHSVHNHCLLSANRISMIEPIRHSTKDFLLEKIQQQNMVRSRDYYLFFDFWKFCSKFLGDERCLGFRADRESEYQWITYEEVEKTKLVSLYDRSFFTDNSNGNRNWQWSHSFGWKLRTKYIYRHLCYQ